MRQAEAWQQFAFLIRRLDPGNDIGHLCRDLRVKGWIVNFSLTPTPPIPDNTIIAGIACSTCGQIVPDGGCRPCLNCGTMTGGCG